MHRSNRPQTELLPILPLIVAGALVAMMILTMWMAASSWRGMGGWGDHMSGMMGGGRDSTDDPQEVGSAVETVIIEDFRYAPGNLSVPVGAEVTWTNRDNAPHSATDQDETWDTGLLSKGESATLTLGEPGTFEYYCTVHPDMKARLVVQ